MLVLKIHACRYNIDCDVGFQDIFDVSEQLWPQSKNASLRSSNPMSVKSRARNDKKS